MFSYPLLRRIIVYHIKKMAKETLATCCCFFLIERLEKTFKRIRNQALDI